MFNKIKSLVFGSKLDPLQQSSQKKIALTALLAWVGLGADGLSSSCYGPQEAFLALQNHTYLALFLAIAIAITVFLIAFGYNQVIELFPSGGGGYQVSTSLLGKYAGLITGAALIMDYSLTIVISIASAVEALFSLLPVHWQAHKLTFDTLLILFLIFLNLRGMKESIKVLLPIFLGFLVTHAFLITYGIYAHRDVIPQVITNTLVQTHSLSSNFGWFFVIALFMHAYAMGGGTYTGLEAVSNNVNVLAQPRVRTGKITMLYMAISLSLTAGGITVLYLLWDVVPNYHQTLNAIAFQNILHGVPFSNQILVLALFFEAGLLFVSATTGFLGGPAVLANMAVDEWVPHGFRNLSNRLVKQNGVLLYGIVAIVLLYITRAHIAYLVVFYSINVFLAFTLSLMGLVKYWWRVRHKQSQRWKRKIILSGTGALVCGTILIMISLDRFFHGGLVSYACLGVIVFLCLLTKRHYESVNRKLNYADKLLTPTLSEQVIKPITFDPQAPCAVFFINKHPGIGMHTLLWSLRMFPNYFKNLIFISIGEIDVECYGAEAKTLAMETRLKDNLQYFEKFGHQNGFAIKTLIDFGINPVEKISALCEKLSAEYPRIIYFASSLVWGKDSWFAQYLHNGTAFALQRRLHMQNEQMIIIPMNINVDGSDMKNDRQQMNRVLHREENNLL